MTKLRSGHWTGLSDKERRKIYQRENMKNLSYKEKRKIYQREYMKNKRKEDE